MTPDLMEAGADAASQPPSERAGRAPRPADSGGRAASYSRVVRPGELDVTHGAHPVPRRHQRQLRRLQGAQQALARHRAGRAALHHRPQRRRQDDDDGHHHRQDAARRRQGLLRLAPSTCCACKREPRSRSSASAASSRSRRCSSSSPCSRTSSSRSRPTRACSASMFFRLDSARSSTGIAEMLHTDPPEGQRAARRRATLSHGQKQWLEIGMLLMQDPKLLLLDEPVAGMTDEETARTAELFLTLEGQAFAGGGRARHELHHATHRPEERDRAARRLVLARGHAGRGAGERAR